MTNINTILFDWDGTLAQTLEVWLDTFREAYSSVGVNLTDKQIGGQFGSWTMYKELGVTPEKEAAYLQHLETIYDKLAETALYPEVAKVLKKLKAEGYKLGLVSASNLKMLMLALKNNQLEDFFDVIISADDTPKHKPDPEPLYMAIRALDSDSNSTIFVGDSDKDTGAAENAQLPLLLFTPKKHDIFYDLEELKTTKCVWASFKDWSDFPFDKLN